jgi:2-dehydro-3-deoxyphosphooctonate aldolase (KDO 8-P synthase)
MTKEPYQVEITPDIHVGGGARLLLIAGPCQVESLDLCRQVAAELKRVGELFPINLVFKSSFDKANRTSGTSQRGPGITAGLEILQQVKAEFGLPVQTDVHSVDQISSAAEVADVLQIPAFLCRQTDLLLTAGKSGRSVCIKKGQFLHPDDMAHCAAKVSSCGNNRIMLCERGTCFGYRDLTVDYRSLLIMRATGYPVVFDATHSVQVMGGAGGASGGARQYVKPLALAAAAVGIDALFLECHPDPDSAPSDGASMLRLDHLEDVIRSVCAVREALS